MKLIFLLITVLNIACTNIPHKKKQNLNLNNKKLMSNDKRMLLVQAAQANLGKPYVRINGKNFRKDCSGTILGIFEQATMPLKLTRDTKSLYDYVKTYGYILKNHPKGGDLVFFHNTYDRNRNGKMDDLLTHVGIVEKIEGDTIYFIHHLESLIIRSCMNLTQPKISIDKATNQRINHMLRKAQSGFRAFNAAELFAGFGRL